MPRRPPRESPTHSIQAYGSRVACLKREGEVVGALMVRPLCYWRQLGHLWWRRFDNAQWAAEVWVTIRGEFNAPFYGNAIGMSGVDELTSLLDELEHNIWVDPFSDDTRPYDLDWLSEPDATITARDEFGIEPNQL